MRKGGLFVFNLVLGNNKYIMKENGVFLKFFVKGFGVVFSLVIKLRILVRLREVVSLGFFT